MGRLSNLRREFRNAVAPICVGLDATCRVATGKTTYNDGGAPDGQMFAVVIVLGPVDQTNEDLLDQLLDVAGELSIKSALEANRTPAGALDVRVTSSSGARPYPQPEGEPHIGAEWQVQVLLD
ncbi:MAG: hypothetical protein EHM90_00420 [Chloroflexi bacterium]|nr:MAG: hypothetical protein EHM90_00420 [Chloroflexota bacterium]